MPESFMPTRIRHYPYWRDKRYSVWSDQETANENYDICETDESSDSASRISHIESATDCLEGCPQLLTVVPSQPKGTFPTLTQVNRDPRTTALHTLRSTLVYLSPNTLSSKVSFDHIERQFPATTRMPGPCDPATEQFPLGVPSPPESELDVRSLKSTQLARKDRRMTTTATSQFLSLPDEDVITSPIAFVVIPVKSKHSASVRLTAPFVRTRDPAKAVHDQPRESRIQADSDARLKSFRKSTNPTKQTLRPMTRSGSATRTESKAQASKAKHAKKAPRTVSEIGRKSSLVKDQSAGIGNTQRVGGAVPVRRSNRLQARSQPQCGFVLVGHTSKACIEQYHKVAE